MKNETVYGSQCDREKMRAINGQPQFKYVANLECAQPTRADCKGADKSRLLHFHRKRRIICPDFKIPCQFVRFHYSMYFAKLMVVVLTIVV